jgi:hypothetical protein
LPAEFRVQFGVAGAERRGYSGRDL